MRNFYLVIAFSILALWSVSIIKQYQADHDDPPCNGIYQVNGYMPCESPWSKQNGGSTQYFYIDESYDGYLKCALWTGSDKAFEAYNNHRAWGTHEEAEKALGKKFPSVHESGNWMKEIKSV